MLVVTSNVISYSSGFQTLSAVPPLAGRTAVDTSVATEFIRKKYLLFLMKFFKENKNKIQ